MCALMHSPYVHSYVIFTIWPYGSPFISAYVKSCLKVHMRSPGYVCESLSKSYVSES